MTSRGKGQARPLLRGSLTAVVVFFLGLFVIGQFGGGAGPGEVGLVAIIAGAAGLAVCYVARKRGTSNSTGSAT